MKKTFVKYIHADVEYSTVLTGEFNKWQAQMAIIRSGRGCARVLSVEVR